MRAIRVSALVALMLFAVKAYPAAAGLGCGKMDGALRAALQSGFAYVATGADLKHGFAANLFINLNTGAWKIIGVDKDLNACTIISGADWQWAISKQA